MTRNTVTKIGRYKKRRKSRSRSPQTMPRLLQMHDSFRCKFKNRRKIRSVAISGELRPRSPSSTIVALSTTNLPILPIEVWELILDWLVVGYTPEVGQTLETNLSLRRDLSSCALVCRTWKIRAQMHLFAFLRISGHGLSQYEALLLKLPALCNSAKELKFYNRDVPDSEGKVAGRTIQTASHAVRIAHKLSNAHYLVMSGINLAVEHPHLARHMAALTQMTRLHFYSTTPTKLIQLARILAGLKHLSILILSFSITADSNPLLLPVPCYATKSSLTKLELFIQPGGHLLVDWLVKARSFITSLQMLHVWLDCQIPQPEIALTTRCVQTFLDNCAGSLREYTTLANIRVDGLTTIPKVSLASHKALSNLSFTVSKVWFEHALEITKTITSEHVTEIKFWYWLDKGEIPSKDLWKELDGILSTGTFKSLIAVHAICVNGSGPDGWCFSDQFDRAELPILLPNTYKRGILFW